MTPAYITLLQEEFPNRSEPEIELMCSITRSLRKVTGLTAHEHRKRGMQKLFPSRAWHPWRDQRVASVQECLEKGIQELAWMGSASCVAGNTRIFNPITREAPTIEELFHRKEQPWVMTLFGAEQAGIPFVKGVEMLYEVTLNTGDSFTCTANHRVLTPTGYKRADELSIGCDIAAVAPCPGESSLELAPSTRGQDEVSSPRITVNSRARCSTYLRLYDGRLPLDQGSDQSFFPSLDDAPTRKEYAFSGEDGRERKARDNRPCSPSRRLSTSSTSQLFENRESLVRRLHASRMLVRGEGQYLSQLQSPEGICPNWPFEEPILDELHTEKLCSREHREQIQKSWGVRVSIARVSAIRNTHTQTFYDITVPRAAHYFAEGAIHHNSGKSADMSDIALTLWWSNPRAMTVYITSPFIDATEKNIWSSIVEQFYEAKDANPSLPGVIRTSQNAIILEEARHPKSIIQAISVDEVGKMKGKKAISEHSGNLVVIVDEFPEFKGLAAGNFMKALANIKSNQNLLVITAGNFTSISDGFARITEPDEDDIPGGWYGFDADTNHRWRTKRGGLALRFDGLKSPNVLEGRDVYPYLTRIGFVATHAEAPGGLQSPDAMREVRSAPITSMEEYTVTNAERIRAGKAKDEVTWTGDEVQRGAFCDFGLGGDPCVVQAFKLGSISTPEGKKQVMALDGAPFTIEIRIGTDVPVQDQAALGLKNWAEGRGLRPENVGYDAAMRPGFAQRVMELYSVKPRAIDSTGNATDRPFNALEKHKDGKPVTWKEKVDRLVSEFWFVVASLVDSGQIRGLELSPKAIDQLCTRRWANAGKKKRLYTKIEHREVLRSMGRTLESPNEADALAGCVEMARRMGLQVEAVAPKGGATKLILDLIREHEQPRNFAGVNSGSALPPGRIHAMTFKSPLAPGKLNRRY